MAGVRAALRPRARLPPDRVYMKLSPVIAYYGDASLTAEVIRGTLQAAHGPVRTRVHEPRDRATRVAQSVNRTTSAIGVPPHSAARRFAGGPGARGAPVGSRTAQDAAVPPSACRASLEGLLRRERARPRASPLPGPWFGRLAPCRDAVKARRRPDSDSGTQADQPGNVTPACGRPPKPRGRQVKATSRSPGGQGLRRELASRLIKLAAYFPRTTAPHHTSTGPPMTGELAAASRPANRVVTAALLW